VPLREVWRNEARDFTCWLQDNIELLNEVLEDISLVSVEREKSAGDFSVDLVAEDQSGGLVVIENQLERSDHDHLGKLITYFTQLEAKAGVWIVAEPRPEHIEAITWLNKSSEADFWLVKVEAVRIDESAPTPLFTQITGPSYAAKKARDTKHEADARHVATRRFWQGLLEKARPRTDLHSTVTPRIAYWAEAPSGQPGVRWVYVILKDSARVELYIDRGADAAEWNKAMFDKLHARREEVEATFGEPLDWQRLDAKRGCRICKILEIGGLADESRWPEIQDAMVETMIRLEKALGRIVKAG
jgi:hypothetical protein